MPKVFIMVYIRIQFLKFSYMKKTFPLMILCFLFISCSYMYKCFPRGSLKSGVKIYLYNPDNEKKKNIEVYNLEIREKVNDTLYKKVWVFSGKNNIKNGFIEYGKGFIPEFEGLSSYTSPVKLKKNTTYECFVKSSEKFKSGLGMGNCSFRINEKGMVVNIP